jgi:hypothetical protein
MSVRTLLLVLSTTTLSVLAGCATTQTAPREDTAASTITQGEGEPKGCGCAHHAKGQDGSQLAAEGKGCGCPHCAQAAKGSSVDKPAACGCSHHDKGGQTLAQDGES